MKLHRLIPLLLLILLGHTPALNAQNVRVVDFPQLKALMERPTDTTYVVNFMASWCRPCIAELPYFKQTAQENQDKKVKVLLISLDFPDQVDTKLKPILKKKNISLTTWLLNDTDYNSWIDKVDPSWSGAIPATLVFNNAKGYKKFIEGEITYDKLANLINPNT